MIDGYEIDFLPTGDDPHMGDAVCLRYGAPGEYRVMVYDAGSRGAGHALVEHIRTHYDTDVIDHVVCAQPDVHDGSGLAVLIDDMQVRELWMHRPWAHADLLRHFVDGGDIAAGILADRLKREVTVLHALEALALERGIPVREPFQGCTIGPFTVLSPERGWYAEDLLAQFATPAVLPVAPPATLWPAVAAAAIEAAAGVAELWGIETLEENVVTAPENETSVVLFGILAERGVLLTGDAGVRALSAAIRHAEESGMPIPDHLRFVQVPHHGNRNNITPSVLDRLVGPISQAPARSYVRAYLSALPHPDAEAVINAFARRGAKVVVTGGKPRCHHYNMEPRDGWSGVEQECAVYRVEPATQASDGLRAA